MNLTVERHGRQFSRMQTDAFAHKHKLKVSTVKAWARKNGLRKDRDFFVQTRSANIRLRWQRRVACAISASGLSHALPDHASAVEQDLSRSVRMLCRQKVVPREVVEKGFPACVKCKRILIARWNKTYSKVRT